MSCLLAVLPRFREEAFCLVFAQTAKEALSVPWPNYVEGSGESDFKSWLRRMRAVQIGPERPPLVESRRVQSSAPATWSAS